MTTDGLFFVAPDEPIDRKRGRILRRLLVFDDDGATRAKIEAQLTGTEADRPVLVTASTLCDGFMFNQDRIKGERSRERGKRGGAERRRKAERRHAGWLEEALKLAEADGTRPAVSIAAEVAPRHGVPVQTVRTVLGKLSAGGGGLSEPPIRPDPFRVSPSSVHDGRRRTGMDFEHIVVERFPEACARRGQSSGRAPAPAPAAAAATAPAAAPAAAPRRECRAAAASFGKSVRGVLLRLAGLLGRQGARESLASDGAAATATEATAPSGGAEPGR